MESKPTTKEKKFGPPCGGCKEPEKSVSESPAKYRIVTRTNKGDGNWEVVFEKWRGCYCTKQEKTVTLFVDGGRFVQTKHLVQAGY